MPRDRPRGGKREARRQKALQENPPQDLQPSWSLHALGLTEAPFEPEEPGAGAGAGSSTDTRRYPGVPTSARVPRTPPEPPPPLLPLPTLPGGAWPDNSASEPEASEGEDPLLPPLKEASPSPAPTPPPPKRPRCVLTSKASAPPPVPETPVETAVKTEVEPETPVETAVKTEVKTEADAEPTKELGVGVVPATESSSAEAEERQPVEGQLYIGRISLDLHGVLDVGATENCTKPAPIVVRSVKRLIDAGFAVWICSYIGQYGPRSEERRAAARTFRFNLAQACGLDPIEGISIDEAHALGYRSSRHHRVTSKGIHLEIVGSKFWDPAKRCGGKAEVVRQHYTTLHVDDQAKVCRELEEAGVLCYQVLDQRRGGNEAYQIAANIPDFPARLGHYSGKDFAEVVEQILFDEAAKFKGEPRIAVKQYAVWDNRKW